MHTLISDNILDIEDLARKFGQIDYTCKITIDDNRNSYSYIFYNNNIDIYVRKLTDRNRVNLN